MKDFRESTVWNKSRWLLLALYKFTEQCPKELCGLTYQLRNSCVNILVNSTRGFALKGHDERVCFLQSLKGSVLKLANQIQFAHERCLLNSSDYKCLIEATNEIKRMLDSYLEPKSDH